MTTIYKCELCNREVSQLTEHHLVPKERGGKDFPTANLCVTCHKQIHALYTNRELAARFFTIDRLKNDEKFKRYLKFISNHSGDDHITIKNQNLYDVENKTLCENIIT